MTLSVVIITYNEEANLARTLESVKPLVASHGRLTDNEIIVVDSGSSDRTVEIAKNAGAKVIVEAWRGYAAQKNFALEKAHGTWILSIDADEELSEDLRREISLAIGRQALLKFELPADRPEFVDGFFLARRNFFLGRWMKHGGFWPDPKLRLFRRGKGRFELRTVHEDLYVEGRTANLEHGALIHHSYPTLSDYIDHTNRYSSLGAEMTVARGRTGFNIINIVLRPLATFIYNYFFRLGFLDGREGLLLHLYHSVYVSWKYAKAWELSRKGQS
ncbi:MAG TPA: glycosyltransferase family 2 protein [Terriglobales bacterium]|nr:glycosyltransferase family 2 protein [Terriglobales bacterium]